MRVEKSFSAFTLAEVLITLGIIGVVAAMTMPTLINQTNGAQYKAAYKKALSAISQGVTLNVALEDISFADATEASSDTSGDKSIAGFLKNRMNVVNVGTGDEYAITAAKNSGSNIGASGDDGNITLYFNDSSVFSFPKAAKECTVSDPLSTTTTGKCMGVIDVNGQKGPNKVVSGSGDSLNITDIYPVIFYDQTILPATDAGKEVLYGK